jgi:hypothetical protein
VLVLVTRLQGSYPSLPMVFGRVAQEEVFVGPLLLRAAEFALYDRISSDR